MTSLDDVQRHLPRRHLLQLEVFLADVHNDACGSLFKHGIRQEEREMVNVLSEATGITVHQGVLGMILMIHPQRLESKMQVLLD